MKKLSALIFAFCFFCFCSLSQPVKPQKLAANPYEARVKTVISQVIDIINGKAAISKLTGTKIPRPSYGSLDYGSPALVFPDALYSSLRQGTANWEGQTGKASWSWQATLLDFIKGSQTERLKIDLQQLAQAMDKLYPKAIKKITSSDKSETIEYKLDDLLVSLFAYYQPEHSTTAYLHLNLYFDLPVGQIKQQVTDSLQQLLDSRLASSNSSKDKAKLIREWAETLQAMGIDKAAIRSQGTVLLKKIAPADINTAFEMLMEWPQSTEDAKAMQDQLSYSDQEVIKQKAQKMVEDYNNKSNKTEPVSTAPDWSVFKGTITPSGVKPEHKNFYDVVAKDLAGVVKETFVMNGSGYYRFGQDYKISQDEYYYFKMSELKRNFVVLFYNEKGIGSKSYVSVEYDGAVKSDKHITGGNCTLDTDCSSNNICKTTCTGTIQVDRIGENVFTYTFKLKTNPDLANTKYLWTVLLDYKQ